MSSMTSNNAADICDDGLEDVLLTVAAVDLTPAMISISRPLSSVYNHHVLLCYFHHSVIMPLPLIDGGIKRCFCLTSVCLTSV